MSMAVLLLFLVVALNFSIMNQKSLPFNPKRDLQPVSQTGFIDLADAFVHGCVPTQLPGADSDYNGIEDAASILGRPSDIFEALEMESRVNAASAPAPSGDKAANTDE